MRNAYQDFLRDDGAQAMISMLCNLFGKMSLKGFKPNQKHIIMLGTLELLKCDTRARELVMQRDDLVITFDRDLENKKQMFKNFRIEVFK